MRSRKVKFLRHHFHTKKPFQKRNFDSKILKNLLRIFKVVFKRPSRKFPKRKQLQRDFHVKTNFNGKIMKALNLFQAHHPISYKAKANLFVEKST